MPSKRIIFILLISVLHTACDSIEHGYDKLERKLRISIEHVYNKLERELRTSPKDIAPQIVQTEKAKIEAITLLNDLYLPWAVSVLPDKTLLITEKSGTLYRFNVSNGTRQSIAGVPDTKHWGQGGLMDVVPHPDFANNRWLYLTYIVRIEGKVAATRLARGRLIDNSLEDVEVLFTAKPGVKSGSHFGSAITFDDAGYLYLTSGERHNRPLVQKQSNHLGKIIRLHDDGRIPGDNPFVGQIDALPEIYSYGHRNPQGIAIEPISRSVWSVEHGPKGGDEVNVIRAGKNYGWPVISYGREYDTGEQIGEGTEKPGMEQPLYQYTPSIAPSGMLFYTGDEFPSWQDDLLIGALKLTHINRLEIEDGQVVGEERIGQLGRRIRDLAQDSQGLLYVLTDDGFLLQLRRAQ